jgi:hypothetical protein
MSAALNIVNDHLAFPKVSLIEPSPSHYIHVAAELDARPAFLPASRRKTGVIERCKLLCERLQSLSGVIEATVFTALLVPPGRGEFLKKREGQVRVARYDLAVLIECRNEAAAKAIGVTPAFAELLRILDDNAIYTHTITATNVRRIGPVDHSRPVLYRLA